MHGHSQGHHSPLSESVALLALNSGGGSHAVVTKFTTTTNAPHVMESIALADNTETAVYVEVQGLQNTAGEPGTPDGAEFQLKGVWFRANGGAPVVVKVPTVVDSNPNANGAAWTAVLLLLGNAVEIVVTGDNGKDVSWTTTRITYEAT